MRVLYVFAGDRSNKFKGTVHVDYPDTQFYGMYHMRDLGLTVDEFTSPAWVRRLLGFRLSHLFAAWRARSYDIVFGSALLYPLLLKRLCVMRTSFVLLNISINRLLRSNTTYSLRYLFVVWLLKGADAVVCLSREQEEFLLRKVPALTGRTHTILLGVDTRFHSPIYEDRSSYILAAGRDNGRDYKTVFEVARQMPTRSFQVVCSKRNLEGLEVPQNVEVFFDLPPAALYQKYQEAQLLLLLTTPGARTDGADCSGQTVLLEAAASGLPIVATKQAYIGEYLNTASDIALVEPESPHEVCRAIEGLDDPAKRREMARSARASIEAKCSSEDMARGLNAVFLELMAK